MQDLMNLYGEAGFQEFLLGIVPFQVGQDVAKALCCTRFLGRFFSGGHTDDFIDF